MTNMFFKLPYISACFLLLLFTSCQSEDEKVRLALLKLKSQKSTFLNLNGNQLEIINDTLLKSIAEDAFFQGIEKVEVANCTEISNEGWRALGKLQHVKTVVINNALIQDGDFNHLINTWDSLRLVSLYDLELEKVNVSKYKKRLQLSFRRCNALKRLKINHCKSLELTLNDAQYDSLSLEVGQSDQMFLALSNISSLEKISLKNFNVSDLEIYLHDFQFKQGLNTFLRKFKNIHSLYLSDMGLEELTLNNYRTIEKFEYQTINPEQKAPLRKVSLQGFNALKNLVLISQELLELKLSNAPELEYLSIDTWEKDFDCKGIGKLNKLEICRLSGASFADELVKELVKLELLESLYVDLDHVSEKQKNAILNSSLKNITVPVNNEQELQEYLNKDSLISLKVDLKEVDEIVIKNNPTLESFTATGRDYPTIKKLQIDQAGQLRDLNFEGIYFEEASILRVPHLESILINLCQMNNWKNLVKELSAFPIEYLGVYEICSPEKALDLTAFKELKTFWMPALHNEVCFDKSIQDSLYIEAANAKIKFK